MAGFVHLGLVELFRLVQLGRVRSSQTIANQLDIARRTLTQHRLDVVEALTLLNMLPPPIADDNVIRQARDAVSAVAMRAGQHLIVARYALARVIVLL